MSTEKLLQFCVSSMAVLATVMLGTSQENSVLPVAAFLAATVALIFTDYFRWFSLHPIVAGAFGLIAGLYALVQSQTHSLADQFVSVANLLIHLQIILLFQKKSIRIYWQLITLSLLQVVVAAALNLFVFFGPLLVLYTGVAICAMVLFFIYRETHPLFESTSRRDQDSFIRVQTAQPKASDRKDPRKRPRRNLIRLSGFRSFAMLSISTLVTSLAVFLLMPRFGDGVWRPSKAKSAATGFNGDEIDLDSSSLYENPSVVMRVSFTDEETKEPYMITGSPYFRGSALSEYENGSWFRVRDLEKKYMDPLDRPQRLISAVRQTVNLETPKRQVVFSLPPAVALEDTTDSIRIKHRTNETRYYPENNEDPAVYSLGTMGLKNGMQSQYSPKHSKVGNENRRRQAQVRRYMPRLASLASDIVKSLPEEDHLARARLLESYFTSGRNNFTYSLDAGEVVQPELDRVVDFVLNHKKGHCQYYASALALMLRSQGIPSRIVVGYRAETYNVVGNYYQLREMDAHAWVEAGIPADQIPKDEVLPAEGIPGDAWVRLDPTPSGDLSIAGARISPWKAKIGDTVDYMQLLWSEYVLGLNEKRQRRAIYEPLQALFKNSTMLLFSREIWVARWESLLQRFQGDLFTRDNIRDSVIAVAVLIASFFVLRTIWRLLGKGFSRIRRRDRQRRPQVEFYARFEKLLAKYGIRRRIEQTPLEFASVAQQRLTQLSADASLREIPKNTVDLFYRVRFGSGPLDTDEAERLENSLSRLQNFLATHRN